MYLAMNDDPGTFMMVLVYVLWFSSMYDGPSTCMMVLVHV